MKTKRYNLSQIMRNAWKMFKQGNRLFKDCLKLSWKNAKDILMQIINNNITEEVHTWYGWKMLGYEVIHESKCLFQIVVDDNRTKTGTRKLSYFGKSQTKIIEESSCQDKNDMIR